MQRYRNKHTRRTDSSGTSDNVCLCVLYALGAINRFYLDKMQHIVGCFSLMNDRLMWLNMNEESCLAMAVVVFTMHFVRYLNNSVRHTAIVLIQFLCRYVFSAHIFPIIIIQKWILLLSNECKPSPTKLCLRWKEKLSGMRYSSPKT